MTEAAFLTHLWRSPQRFRAASRNLVENQVTLERCVAWYHCWFFLTWPGEFAKQGTNTCSSCLHSWVWPVISYSAAEVTSSWLKHKLLPHVSQARCSSEQTVRVLCIAFWGCLSSHFLWDATVPLTGHKVLLESQATADILRQGFHALIS